MIDHPAPIVQTTDLAAYVVGLRARLEAFAPSPPPTNLQLYVMGLRARLRAFAAGEPIPRTA